jgi:hypothetical protein
MKLGVRLALAALLLAALAVCGSAYAEEPADATPEPAPPAEAPPSEPPQAETPPPPPPPTYYQRALAASDAISRRDDRLLWGRSVERLPRNTLGVRVDYYSRRFDSRFDDDGEVGDAIPRMHLRDPFGKDATFLDLNTQVNGRIETTDFRLSYGILDALTAYVAFPIVKQSGWLTYKFDPGTCASLGVRTADEAFRFFEQYGRPKPDQRHTEHGWSPGDLEVGLSWSYLDRPWGLAALQGALVTPTGRVAEPNRALRFGLGPQVDNGGAAYAPGVTHTLNLHFPEPVNWIGFWVEGSFFYYLPATRLGPRWREPDPTIARQQVNLHDARLIDLSDVDRRHTVTRGAQVDSLAGFDFAFAYFNAGLGYLFEVHQEPLVAGDAKLREFLKASEAYTAGASHALILQVGVPLSPVLVPGLLNVGYEFPLGGRNELRLEDRLNIQGEIVLPLW